MRSLIRSVSMILNRTPILVLVSLAKLNLYLYECFEGARGVMVIIAGNEHGDSTSNPGHGCLKI